MELISRIADSHREPGSLPLSRLAKQYLADYRTRAAPSSYDRERRNFDRLADLLGDPDMRTLTPGRLAEYRSARMQAGASVSTVNLETMNLRRACAWAVEHGLLEENPLEDFRALRQRARDVRKKRRALTEEEIGKLYEATEAADEEARARAPSSIPQAPLIRAFLETGARRGELVRTRWRHWTLEPVGDLAGEVRFVRTKSGHDRIVPIRRELADAVRSLQPLQEAILGHPPSEADYVFWGARGKPYAHSENPSHLNALLVRLLKLAEIPREVDGWTVDVHALRTTFGTRMAEAEIDLGERAYLMGHSSPQLTERAYTRRSSRHHNAAARRLAAFLRESGGGLSESQLAELLRGVDPSSLLPQGELEKDDAAPLGPPPSPAIPEEGEAEKQEPENPGKSEPTSVDRGYGAGDGIEEVPPATENPTAPTSEARHLRDTGAVLGISSEPAGEGREGSLADAPILPDRIQAFPSTIPGVWSSPDLAPGEIVQLTVVGAPPRRSDDNDDHPRGASR